MENTQGVWILYAIVLMLNFLISEKQGTTTKRPEIERGIVEISQPRYFKTVLTLKKKPKCVFVKSKSKKCFGEVVLLLFPQETRGCEFVPGLYGSGLIKVDLLNLDR